MSMDAGAPSSPYIADDALRIAAEVAMDLGQPLLLTGEAGTGKSSFAQHVATKLAPDWFARDGEPKRPLPLLTFHTKSTSSATDLFYRYDSLRRFHASHDKSGQMSQDNRDYIAYEALGQAILRTRRHEEVAELLGKQATHSGPERCVVLIDEIDKAPRDFPNDILNEIDKYAFEVPEVTLGGHVARVAADTAYKPILVLTSNSEKNLPAAFLRRCVFHHIGFPEKKDRRQLLVDIVHANLGHAAPRLAESAIDFFYEVRALQDLDKRPATDELVKWIRALTRRLSEAGLPADAELSRLDAAVRKATLGVLMKSERDLPRAAALVDQPRKPA